MVSQSTREQSCLLLYVLLRPATDWMMPAHIAKGHLLYSVHQLRHCSLPGTPSQIHAEILLHQLSQHHEAQSSHTIEGSNMEGCIQTWAKSSLETGMEKREDFPLGTEFLWAKGGTVPVRVHCNTVIKYSKGRMK